MSMRAGSLREPWFGEGRQFIAVRPPARYGIAKPDEASPPRQHPYPCRSKPSAVHLLREAAAQLASPSGTMPPRVIRFKKIPAPPTEEGGGQNLERGGGWRAA